MTDRRPLLILGAGSFAIEVLEAAELAGARVAGFVVSDDLAPPTLRHAGLPVFVESAVPFAPHEVSLAGGIVTTRRRAFVERMAARGFTFLTVVHPSAIVSPRARLDEGAFVGAGVIVASHTRVGAHVLLNRGANVGHDNEVEPFVTIGPGILADLVLVAGMVYDKRTRGRVHGAYWVALACIVAVQLLRVPLSTSGAWKFIANALVALVP